MEANNNNEKIEDLLLALLNCGYADLPMVTDSKFEMYEIVDFARDELDIKNPNINDLISAMLQLGIGIVANYIEDSKEDVYEGLSEEDKELFDSIEFDPYEDITIYVNCIDSHAYLNEDKKEYYDKFFPETANKFEEMTDISLT